MSFFFSALLIGVYIFEIWFLDVFVNIFGNILLKNYELQLPKCDAKIQLDLVTFRSACLVLPSLEWNAFLIVLQQLRAQLFQSRLSDLLSTGMNAFSLFL